ncbi:hypothetical protein SLEP1_g44071 [Rubroshorea leprosula]|uniref:Uncharacterized protein n=1 Tax=Rubroshorea leprosula TaxID=152421 RepID=A0AAV5LFJ9_9ROSI|nr:hypothetical protein SLEP1_g44071 [Rubroshorea leprosula]
MEPSGSYWFNLPSALLGFKREEGGEDSEFGHKRSMVFDPFSMVDFDGFLDGGS